MVFSYHPLKEGHHLGRGEPCLGHLSWRYLPTARSCEMALGETHTFTCSSFLTFCRTSWWSPRKAISDVAALAVVSWPPNSSSVADSFSSLCTGQRNTKQVLNIVSPPDPFHHHIAVHHSQAGADTQGPGWGCHLCSLGTWPWSCAPHPTAWLQPLHPSALHKQVYCTGRGGRASCSLILAPKDKHAARLGERDGPGLGEPHLHVELLPIALCVLHQQLQRILVATLRLLAGHLGTDVLLDLGMDDVACPQALARQQGEQRGT